MGEGRRTRGEGRRTRGEGRRTRGEGRGTMESKGKMAKVWGGMKREWQGEGIGWGVRGGCRSKIHLHLDKNLILDRMNQISILAASSYIFEN